MEEICLNCRFAKYADDDKEDLRCLEPKFNMRLAGTILSNSVCEDNGCGMFEKRMSQICFEILDDPCIRCKNIGNHDLCDYCLCGGGFDKNYFELKD